MTVAALERRVAALDGASGAIALASGMAAVSYVLFNAAEGGRVLTTPKLYGGTIDSFKKIYPKLGVGIDFAKDVDDPAIKAAACTYKIPTAMRGFSSRRPTTSCRRKCRRR